MGQRVMVRRWLAALAVPAALVWAGQAMGQEGSRHNRHTHRVRAAFVPARPLTVNPAPAPEAPPPTFEPSLVGQDDADGYGSISRFNPDPYVTSGTQLPFGLDGVGGYGSDLGFGAGEDAGLYQR